MPSARFSLFGFPIRVEFFFFLSAVFLGWRGRDGWLLLAWVAIVFVAVMVHEFGHTFAYRRYGQHSQIVLHGFGGVTMATQRLAPAQRIVVSLAGPLSGIVVLGIPAWILRESVTPSSFEQAVIMHDLFYVNVWWSLINLLPMWPLDGGQILHSATELRGGEPNRRLVHSVGLVTAVLLGLYFLSRGHTFGLIFALILAVMNGSWLWGSRPMAPHAGYVEAVEAPVGRERRRKPKKDKRVRPAARVERAWLALADGRTDAARADAEAVLGGVGSAAIDVEAAEIVAWSHLRERQLVRARGAVDAHGGIAAASPCLRAAFALSDRVDATSTMEMARALVTAAERPVATEAADWVGRLGVAGSVARALVELPDGQGFETAVRLEAYLNRAGRRDQAAAVAGILWFGDGIGDAGEIS